jgi:hypothetical protein
MKRYDGNTELAAVNSISRTWDYLQGIKYFVSKPPRINTQVKRPPLTLIKFAWRFKSEKEDAKLTLLLGVCRQVYD